MSRRRLALAAASVTLLTVLAALGIVGRGDRQDIEHPDDPPGDESDIKDHAGGSDRRFANVGDAATSINRDRRPDHGTPIVAHRQADTREIGARGKATSEPVTDGDAGGQWWQEGDLPAGLEADRTSFQADGVDLLALVATGGDAFGGEAYLLTRNGPADHQTFDIGTRSRAALHGSDAISPLKGLDHTFTAGAAWTRHGRDGFDGLTLRDIGIQSSDLAPETDGLAGLMGYVQVAGHPPPTTPLDHILLAQMPVSVLTVADIGTEVSTPTSAILCPSGLLLLAALAAARRRSRTTRRPTRLCVESTTTFRY